MMESRVRVGVELNALDIHARKIARGRVEVTEVTWPEKERKLTKKQKAKATRDAQNPKLGV